MISCNVVISYFASTFRCGIRRVSNLTKFTMYKYWTCEKMKMFGGLFGGRSTIKVTSKLLKIQKSRTRGCNLTFDPWKLSGRERQKGKIKRSNTLFADQKAWSRSQTLQQATYKWLPLAVTDWISGNDWRLAQPSQMRVTDYSTSFYITVANWCENDAGMKLCKFTFTIISSLPCLHTLWHAIPTSFYIFNVFLSLVF